MLFQQLRSLSPPGVVKTRLKDGLDININYYDVFLKLFASGYYLSFLIQHQAIAIKDQFVLATY
ncbi:hypothetical protein ES703_102575 [subsurface metagenome]